MVNNTKLDEKKNQPIKTAHKLLKSKKLQQTFVRLFDLEKLMIKFIKF